jgi:hypothetical protein
MRPGRGPNAIPSTTTSMGSSPSSTRGSTPCAHVFARLEAYPVIAAINVVASVSVAVKRL